MSYTDEDFLNLQRALHEEKIINEASDRLSSTLYLDDVVDDVLNLLNNLITADTIVISIKEASDLVDFYVWGDASDAILLESKRRPQYKEVAELVTQQLKHVIINDNDSQEGKQAISTLHKSSGRLSTTIAVPLIMQDQQQGQLYGMLQAFGVDSKQFTSDNLRTIARFAKLLSYAFEQSFQYNEKVYAESRYHALLEDSIIPILVISQQGIIRMVNQRAMELLRHPSHDMLGKSVDTLHKKPIFDDILAQIHTNPTHVVKVRADVVTADKQTLPTELNVRQTRNGDIQWMYRDLSEDLIVEKRRDDLTAMLVHDLKGPLSNILTSLEMLQEDLPNDENSLAQIMIQVANRSGQWLYYLVHSLLDINQLEAGSPIAEKEMANVANLVHSAQQVILARLESCSLQVVVKIAEDFPLVHVNIEMIERVFINLLDNALKFSPTGGKIIISARIQNPYQAMISVQDEGYGIPKEEHEQIFAKFYTRPENNTKGIGLGLAFCRLVIEAHGGQIWVDPSSDGQDQGAQFNFTVPISRVNNGYSGCENV